MGHHQHTPPVKATCRRFPSRTCLRKGCRQFFQASRWNQRYCQAADCLREVRRWHAAKRQRAYRQSAENRKRQAAAEAQRRRAKKEAATSAAEGFALETSGEGIRKPSSRPISNGAWSRRKKIPAEFCDRVGCYEPLPANSRAPARYCGGDCRQAIRRVRERERKWFNRNGVTATTKRCNKAVPTQPHDSLNAARPGDTRAPVAQSSNPLDVRNYRSDVRQTLSSGPAKDPLTRSPHEDDDSETSAHRRSRPPPTG